MAGVALALLIGCANIAGLMLARASTRAKMAVRTAVGASRSGLLVQNLATGPNSVFIDLALDGRILGFTAGVAVLTGILAGLVPAVRTTSVSSIAAMKSRQMAGAGVIRRFTRASGLCPRKWRFRWSC